jgi:hypothetical protein
MEMKNITVIIVLVLGLAVSCSITKEKETESSTILPSWNDTQNKQDIIDFVEDITDAESASFVPAADRIAVFDNDGTLWAEKPFYFQLLFAVDRVKELAPNHPEWKNEQPFKAVLENDMNELVKYGEHGLLQLVMATHSDMSTDEFEIQVNEWINEAMHPKFNISFTDLVYQPMLELITYLNQNDFKVFIVSGGGIEFMRAWAEEVYGIPKHQIIGSSVKLKFEDADNNIIIRRLAEIDFINDKEGKPIGIQKHIGRKPIFCAGNSDGDLAMMQWTSTSSYKYFNLYIHHTDSVREWKYDRNSAVGRLDKGLDEARNKNWTIVDMEADWEVVFPFQLK